MKKIMIGLSLLSALVFQNALGDILKVNIPDLQKKGLVAVEKNTLFHNGPFEFLFDDAFETSVMTQDVNPLVLQFIFNDPITCTQASTIMENDGDWSVEVAATVDDMENQTGSYESIISNLLVYGEQESVANFSEPATFSVIRLTLRRTIAFEPVRVRELSLFSEVDIQSLYVYPDQIKVEPGLNLQLEVLALDAFNRPFQLTSTPQWLVDNPSLASVNSSGLLTGIASGNTNVRINANSISNAFPVSVESLSPSVLDDPLDTVNVFVVIEDPYNSSDGKFLHELKEWNDPNVLSQQLKNELEAASGGLVNYNIVDIHQANQYFGRLSNGDHHDPDSIYKWFQDANNPNPPFNPPQLDPSLINYDYMGLIEEHDLCTARNNDQIHEVWVWSYPWVGSYEIIEAGKNAFWLNGPPFPGTTCEKSLKIGGFNFERTVDLAIHSYGHGAEGIFKKLFGRWDNENQLPNLWERYTAYDQVTPGSGQIGNIHFPPNAVADYDYDNTSNALSGVDNWAFYPYVLNRSRNLNCFEWGDCGEFAQLGYMRFWFSNLPKFKGSNGGVWNNWWRYIVDYQKAIEDLGWNPNSSSSPLIAADFSTGRDGFVYVDDAFRSTSQPGYASGQHLPSGGFVDGGLSVTLGGLDNNTILNMSGGWQRSFTLSEEMDLTLSLRYNLSQQPDYEGSEYSEILVAVNGQLFGSGGDDYLDQITGDGNGGPVLSTGWQLIQVSLGTFQPGNHTLTIGSYNNQKSYNNESTDALFDDVQLTGTPTQSSDIIIDEDFNSDPGLFSYQDDTFRGTTQPSYADGDHRLTGGSDGGGLFVSLGGLDNNTIQDMSGGWSQSFTLSEASNLTLSFRYNLTQQPDYESSEFSQALFSLDGNLMGTGGNDYLQQIIGDGNGGPQLTSGWVLVQFDLGTQSAGNHVLTFGGYNNQKTYNNESTEIGIDDVLLTRSISSPEEVLNADFDGGVDGFSNLDDIFRGTNNPAYASGAHDPTGGFSSGALRVDLGGIDNQAISGMSNGWENTFNLTSSGEVTVSLRYNLTQSPDYESDEFSQVLLEVDGNLMGSGGNDFVDQINGNGNGGPSLTTDWQVFQIDLGTLSAGSHVIRIGGYNNKKTYNNESSAILIDDLVVTVQP